MTLSKTMEEAIKENDLGKIYSSFYTILLSDPGFANGKFDQVLKELKKRNIEGLFQTYDGKLFKGREEWNQKYWDCVASELMDNFCVERIEHLKDIGKVLYPSVKSQTNVQKKTELIQLSNHNQSSNAGKLIAVVTVVVMILIIVIVLVL